ncbi:MAG: hypothetical protein GXP25_24575 [Planctomycetes bacterium]|nr:hypothetical protein [Planctomycetota bacterium]
MDMVEFLARLSPKLRFLSRRPVKALFVSWIDYYVAYTLFAAFANLARMDDAAFLRMKDIVGTEVAIAIFWGWFAVGLLYYKPSKTEKLSDNLARVAKKFVDDDGLGQKHFRSESDVMFAVGMIIGVLCLVVTIATTLLLREFYATFCLLGLTWNRCLSLFKAEGRERLIGIRWLVSLGVFAGGMVIGWPLLETTRSRVLIEGGVYFLFQGVWDTVEILTGEATQREEQGQ